MVTRLIKSSHDYQQVVLSWSRNGTLGDMKVPGDFVPATSVVGDVLLVLEHVKF